MLLRAIIWFSMVLLLIPVKNDRLSDHSPAQSRAEALEIVNWFVAYGQKMCGEHKLPCEQTQALAGDVSTTIYKMGVTTPVLAGHITDLAHLIVSGERSNSEPELAITIAVDTKRFD